MAGKVAILLWLPKLKWKKIAWKYISYRFVKILRTWLVSLKVVDKYPEYNKYNVQLLNSNVNNKIDLNRELTKQHLLI